MEAIAARGVQALVALAGAYAVALWFVLIVWAFRDIETRSRSVITQVFSTLLVVLFYVPGVLLYMILRPKETLDEAFQHSLEEEYLLQDLEELPLCPKCQRYVEDDFVLCPHCRTTLREPCGACGRLVDLRWPLCPYCGAAQDGKETVEQVEQPAARWSAPLPWRRGPAEAETAPELEPEQGEPAAIAAGVAAAAATEFEQPAAATAQPETAAFPALGAASALVRPFERFRVRNGFRRPSAEPANGNGNASTTTPAVPLFRMASEADLERAASYVVLGGHVATNGNGHANGHATPAGDAAAHANGATPDGSAAAGGDEPEPDRLAVGGGDGD